MKAKLVSFNCFNNKGYLMGGAEIHLYNVAKVLSENGYEVDIIQKWYKDSLIYKKDEISVYGIKALTDLSFILKWPKKIDYHNDEIIHLNDLSLVHPVTSRVHKLTATFHGIFWDQPSSLPPKIFNARTRVFLPLYKRWIKFITLFDVKMLKKILCVDTSLLRIVESDASDYRTKLKIIYNFVDLNQFNPNVKRSKFLENFPVFRKKLQGKIVLFPRNISYARGFIQAIKALKILTKKLDQNVYLIFVGEPLIGPELNYLKYLIRHLGLENRVVLLGGVPHEKMPMIYRSCDVAIIPSLYREGTSISALEAMACKVPVVASRVGGLNDIIIDGFNGLLVEPGNEGDLANAIYNILSKSSLKTKLIENALVFVKNFSKEKWASKIIEFFRYF